MSFIRAARRLSDDQATSPVLATALRDWAAQAGDSEVALRLERKLSGPLATPVSARAAPARPSWLLGLSMAAVIAILALCLAEHARAPRDDEHSTQQQARAMSTAVTGNYLGAGPRDLASVGPATVLYAMHH